MKMSRPIHEIYKTLIDGRWVSRRWRDMLIILVGQWEVPRWGFALAGLTTACPFYPCLEMSDGWTGSRWRREL